METMNHVEYVKRCLAQPGVQLTVIAEEAGVGYSWLKMFARGEIPDPGYSRVKALTEYFHAKQAA